MYCPQFLPPLPLPPPPPLPIVHSQQHYANQPNYLLLVNGKDKQSFSTSYITQELLQGIVNTKVMWGGLNICYDDYLLQ